MTTARVILHSEDLATLLSGRQRREAQALVDQPRAHGAHRRLGAVRDAQLDEDVLYVALDRGRAEEQVVSNLLVGQPFGHHAQHLEFARGERLLTSQDAYRALAAPTCAPLH